jgi:hypothetical protein
MMECVHQHESKKIEVDFDAGSQALFTCINQMFEIKTGNINKRKKTPQEPDHGDGGLR